MISINLVPEKKRWFPYWLIFDVAIMVMAAGIGYVILTEYKTDVDVNLADSRSSLKEINSDINDLDPMTDKFSELKNYQSKLAGQIDEVRSKALSQFVRYRPVILLEQIQNLKPAGLWLQRVQLLPDDNSAIGPGEEWRSLDNAILIQGYALDNIILSDFLTALRSTENFDVIEGDLRTNLFFKNLGLESSLAKNIELNIVDAMAEERTKLNDKLSKQLASIKLQKFKLVVQYGERGLGELENTVGSPLIVADREG